MFPHRRRYVSPSLSLPSSSLFALSVYSTDTNHPTNNNHLQAVGDIFGLEDLDPSAVCTGETYTGELDF